MPGRRNPPADQAETLAQIEARLDEVARLLALLVGRDRSLQDTVADLSALNFGPTRIAELLGTTPGYAKVAVGRARQRKGTAGTKGKQ
jgi:hypothetical protein